MAAERLGKSMEYPHDTDPLLGYTRGVIVNSDVDDYKCVRAAEAVLVKWYKERGFDSIYNLMGVADNCTLPDYFHGPEWEERYLATRLSEERLDVLAKEQLGGDDGFRAAAFNRTTSAAVTAMVALAEPGTSVPYLAPPFARPRPEWTIRGQGHPCTARGIGLSGAEAPIIFSLDELRDILANKPVSAVAICPRYRGALSEAELRQAIRLGNEAEVPVWVDDASGARTRVVLDGEARAIDMGADVVVTSCEKLGLNGPRAGLIVGRNELMDRIGTKATILGTEARPGIAAAIVRALEEWSPSVSIREEEARAAYARQLQPLAREIFGDRVGADDFFVIVEEDVLEIAMERAGITQCEFAPLDAVTALGMILVRRYGYMTLPAFSYPGASKRMSIGPPRRDQKAPEPDVVIRNLDAAFDELARVITSREEMEELLFGAP
jgi:L-seryl-tRNA(Ser) seleniumtransferase